MLATLSVVGAASRALSPLVVSADGLVRYFAFGSNLLRSKVEGRGADGPIAPTACYAAVVRGHRLAFNMRMFPPLEPAMASLEPCEGDACEGAVYELSRDDYERLWKSEGGAMERSPYEEVVVRASVRRPDGSVDDLDVITLRAAPWTRLRRDAPPSRRYLSLITTGARELSLSPGYLERLDRVRAAEPSAPLRAIAQAHGVLAIALFRAGLRRALAPWRAACYAFTYAGPSAAMAAASEAILCAVLLPTAAIGALLRAARAMFGLPPLMMGPPPPARGSDAPAAQSSASEAAEREERAP